MERQLDAGAADLLAPAMEELGVDVLLERQTEAILGNGRAEGLRFAGGEELDVDLVVVVDRDPPAGRPGPRHAGSTSSARSSSTTGCARARPRVWAVGECAEHRGVVYGIVAPIHEQAAWRPPRCSAVPSALRRLGAEREAEGGRRRPRGRSATAEGERAAVVADDDRGRYRKLVVEHGRAAGARAARRHARPRAAAGRGARARGGRATRSGAARRGRQAGAADLPDDRAGLQLQRRLQGRDRRRRAARHGCSDAARGDGAHPRRHGLRLLQAAGRRARRAGGAAARSRSPAYLVPLPRARRASSSPSAIREQRARVGQRGVRGLRRRARVRRLQAGAAPTSSRRSRQPPPRGARRALHQRPRARQHPEGRHVLGRAAHPRRRRHARRAAAHRRRRREVRGADGQDHRRPAHRPARRAQGAAARRLGGPRHAVGPRLHEGGAHGQDLRRHRLLPLRPRRRDRPRRSRSSGACEGLDTPAQGEARPSPAARATAPRPTSRTSASSRSRAAGRSTSAARRARRAQGRPARDGRDRATRRCAYTRPLPPVLPRERRVPGAHLRLRRAGRDRHGARGGARPGDAAPRCSSASGSRKAAADPDPWRERDAPVHPKQFAELDSERRPDRGPHRRRPGGRGARSR